MVGLGGFGKNAPKTTDLEARHGFEQDEKKSIGSDCRLSIVNSSKSFIIIW
jgi:hypothetical protein